MSKIMRISTATVIYYVDDNTFDMSRVKKATMYIKNVNGSESFSFEEPVIDTEEKSFSVHLTQEQTKMLSLGSIEVQVHIKLDDDNVIWTELIKTTIGKVIGEDIL